VNVFSSGFPKSGTHALAKAIELLGQPTIAGEHRTYAEGVPADVTHHVFIKRDPRNIVLSWLRSNREPVTPGMVMSRIQRFDQHSLVEEMRPYEGWLVVGQTLRTHVVRYEDLIADDKALRGIAEFLGVPYIEDAWEQLEGHTITYFPEHSDYRKVWNEAVAKRWTTSGGDALLRRWGY